MAIARRGREAKAGVPAVLGLKSAGILEDWPDLAAFLTQATWEDGSPRATGTAMVFTEEGRWKVWLHDRDAGQGCFVSGATLGEALGAAEAAAAGEAGDWRADRKGGKRGG